MLVTAGFLTIEELASGRPDAQRASMPVLTLQKATELVQQGVPCSRLIATQQRFEIGQLVHTRIINPSGHTRLPRYAREKVGTIDQCRGLFVFPDSNAHFLGEQAQPLYCVRFSARARAGG